MNGCSGVVEGHGLCNKHYKRWQKYGDPTITKRAPKGAGSINGTGCDRATNKERKARAAC